MKIGIIGSSGRLGKVLTKILKRKNTVIACNKPECDRSVIENADLTFLCTPLKDTIQIITEFKNVNNLIEVTSIKTPFLKYKNKIISIHPLFGPRSYNKISFKNIIYITDISIEGTKEKIVNLFPDYHILDMTAIEHDKFISQQLVFPYILSILSNKYNLDNAYTNSAFITRKLSYIFENENKEVLFDTIIYNPYSIEIIRNLNFELNKIGGIIDDFHS
ncbi:MAG: hypothetical protein ACP5TO_04465 [Thermoplasmata archaeon]